MCNGISQSRNTSVTKFYIVCPQHRQDSVKFWPHFLARKYDNLIRIFDFLRVIRQSLEATWQNSLYTHSKPLTRRVLNFQSFCIFLTLMWPYRLRWSRGSVLAFGTEVCGFKTGRGRRIFKGEKILSTPSFGAEVKPSVPCHRFAACKRSLELYGSRILDEIFRNISHPQRVPPFAARGLSRRWTWRHLAEKMGTSKGGKRQWQSTPKNLPRMQCARAIPVAWMGSGSC
jgi:hypothetical protein